MPQDVFWTFSTTLYAFPNTPQICLRMQNKHGCDVNMAMFSLWCGLRLGRPNEELTTQFFKLAHEWRARTVEPLRKIRSDLKSGPNSPHWPGALWEETRQSVKNIELNAEKALHTALESLALRSLSHISAPNGLKAAEQIFTDYVRLAGLSLVDITPDWRDLAATAARMSSPPP